MGCHACHLPVRTRCTIDAFEGVRRCMVQFVLCGKRIPIGFLCSQRCPTTTPPFLLTAPYPPAHLPSPCGRTPHPCNTAGVAPLPSSEVRILQMDPEPSRTTLLEVISEGWLSLLPFSFIPPAAPLFGRMLCCPARDPYLNLPPAQSPLTVVPAPALGCFPLGFGGRANSPRAKGSLIATLLFESPAVHALPLQQRTD